MSEKPRTVKYQPNCFVEPDDITINNEDTATVTLHQLITFYRLKQLKEESFLVVRSQPKFSGSIVSAEIPISMALRELKDLKKYNYKVYLSIYLFPALVPITVIDETKKSKDHVILLDKTSELCVCNQIISEFLEITSKKETHFRYTMIVDENTRINLNSSKTLAFYQFQESKHRLELTLLPDFEKMQEHELIPIKDCQQDGEITLKKKIKGKEGKPITCYAILRDAVLYFCKSPTENKPTEGALSLDYFTFTVQKIDGEDTIVLETASNQYDKKKSDNGSTPTNLVVPEKKPRRMSIGSIKITPSPSQLKQLDSSIYHITPKNKVTFLNWHDAIRSHTRNTTCDVVFGTTLTDLMTREINATRKIPHILEDCINYLDNPEAIDEEGIFRKTGTLSTVEELIKAYDNGKEIVFSEIPGMDCHTASSIIKRWLGRLGDPLLFPYEDFIEIYNQGETSQGQSLSECPLLSGLLLRLPLANMSAISFLVTFLYKVSLRSEVNKMSVNNLAVVIGPNALRKRGLQPDSLGDSIKVISIFECLIQYHETVQSILKQIELRVEEENAHNLSRSDAIQDSIQKLAAANLGLGDEDFGFLGGVDEVEIKL